MTNEQLAALLYQLACRLNIELVNINNQLTTKQKDGDLLAPAFDVVYELKKQVEMLTGEDCPTV